MLSASHARSNSTHKDPHHPHCTDGKTEAQVAEAIEYVVESGFHLVKQNHSLLFSDVKLLSKCEFSYRIIALWEAQPANLAWKVADDGA